jgi:hypothetical protein
MQQAGRQAGNTKAKVKARKSKQALALIQQPVTLRHNKQLKRQVKTAQAGAARSLRTMLTHADMVAAHRKLPFL